MCADAGGDVADAGVFDHGSNSLALGSKPWWRRGVFYGALGGLRMAMWFKVDTPTARRIFP